MTANSPRLSCTHTRGKPKCEQGNESVSIKERDLNQAATDAKQRPGFQTRKAGNGIAEIDGKAAAVAATELGQRSSFKTGKDRKLLKVHDFMGFKFKSHSSFSCFS